MRTERQAEILKNPYIEKVVLSQNKTKNIYQWLGYLQAKQRERYE